MIFSLYAKIAAVLALVAALTVGYLAIEHRGIVKGRAEVQAKWDEAKAKQIIANDKARTELNDIASQLETAKNERQIVTQTITKQVTKLVDRPVYRNICLDPDGLRIANAAIAGKATDIPAATVQTAPAN